MDVGKIFSTSRSRAHLQKAVNEADKVVNPLQGLEAFLTLSVDSDKAKCLSTAEPFVASHFHIEYKRKLTKRFHKSCMVS